MKNTRSRKKRNSKPQTIGTWFCVCVMLLIGLLFVFSALQNYGVLKNEDGRIVTYEGTFIYTKKQHLRNTNLVFTLGNGDSICIPCEYIHNISNLKDFSQLTFQYSAHNDFLNSGAHYGISVISVDGGYVFLQESVAKRMLQSSITGFLVVGIPCVLLSLVVIVCNSSCLAIIYKKRKRQQNKSKRHKEQ